MNAADYALTKRQLALLKIEQAQELLDQAAVEISPVLGMSREWTAVCKAYQDIQALWERVRRAHPTGLDHNPKEGCACGCGILLNQKSPEVAHG